MRWIWHHLPGPRPLRMASAVLLATVVLVALHFIYEWMGDFLLDNGGAIG